MFGIVLWANKETGNALVWCEDQRELALLDSAVVSAEDVTSVCVNDHMFFEMDRHSGVRRIVKVLQRWAPPPRSHNLTDILDQRPRLKAG